MSSKQGSTYEQVFCLSRFSSVVGHTWSTNVP